MANRTRCHNKHLAGPIKALHEPTKVGPLEVGHTVNCTQNRSAKIVIVIASPGKQIKNKIIWRIERLTYFLNDDAAFTFNFNIWLC